MTPRAALLVGQLRDHVVGAADLERAAGLQALALQPERPARRSAATSTSGVTFAIGAMRWRAAVTSDQRHEMVTTWCERPNQCPPRPLDPIGSPAGVGSGSVFL